MPKLKKINTILFDVDDCMLKYIDGFREYANEYYGFKMEGQPAKYSLDGWMPCDVALRREIMGTFNTTWQFGCLEPLPDAVEIVQRIVRLNTFNVYRGAEPLELVALSKCGTDPSTMALRKANLHHVFGDVFSEIILIDGSQSKKHVVKKLQRHRNILISLDDYVLNCVETLECGVPTVIMRHSTNLNIADRYPHIPVSSGWRALFHNHISPILLDLQKQ